MAANINDLTLSHGMTGLPKQCDGKCEELLINDHYTKLYVNCFGCG